jgi:hypothetical protein
MGPIDGSELGGGAHRDGADRAAATVVPRGCGSAPVGQSGQEARGDGGGCSRRAPCEENGCPETNFGGEGRGHV